MLLLTFSALFKHANIIILDPDEPLFTSWCFGRTRLLHPARKEMLVRGWARRYKRCDKVGEGIGYYVNYYAHTAVRSDGTSDRNPANWQLLSTHLRNIGL
jgi:hypothetical protein